jgi:hypothetical protein
VSGEATPGPGCYLCTCDVHFDLVCIGPIYMGQILFVWLDGLSNRRTVTTYITYASITISQQYYQDRRSIYHCVVLHVSNANHGIKKVRRNVTREWASDSGHDIMCIRLECFGAVNIIFDCNAMCTDCTVY